MLLDICLLTATFGQQENSIYVCLCLFNVPDYRNEELLPNWKVPAFQTSKTKSEEASPVLYIM